MRSKIKVDRNSFLLQGRKNFILKNYQNIKVDFIQDNLLPDYNTFFAKDVEYYTFKNKKQTKGGISYFTFNFILFIIIVIGLFIILKKK